MAEAAHQVPSIRKPTIQKNHVLRPRGLPKMTGISLHDLRTVLDGRLLGSPSSESSAWLPSIAIDSREVEPGGVFWALPGSTRDGAHFVDDAYRRGAAGAIVAGRSCTPPDGAWALVVDDSRQALWQLAQWQRDRFRGQVIGVAGSAGKTTTRQMIHAVLGAKFAGAASPRNYNNQVGVPLSMLDWRPEHDYAVIELAGSAPRELALLAGLSRPHFCAITNVGDAPLGAVGSRDRVADAESELLRALPTDGLAVLNGDDYSLKRLAARCATRVTWVGRGADCDLVATEVRSASGRLSFAAAGQKFLVPVWGRHHLTSALEATAIGMAWGISPRQIADALAEYQPPPLRCQSKQVGSATLISDAYNDSPAAMHAALELLGEVPTSGRRIVVCGDMRELGDDAPRLHQRLGDEVVTVSNADLLVACGDYADEIVDGAQAAGMPRERTLACRDAVEAAPYLRHVVGDGDVILIKGSRAAALERLVDVLESTLEGEPVLTTNHD
jgi:UDP-N-acetylmuramoyl-tripeptide--D-alanyl-D-alanine ligase